MVDGSQFLGMLGSHDSVAEAGLAPCAGDQDARTLAHLLIDQVSLCEECVRV